MIIICFCGIKGNNEYRGGKTLKNKTIIIILVTIIAFIGIILFINIQNDLIANNTKKELINTQLPNDTKIIDSISVAGKLTGNGNGMQYFGAILIKTDMSKEELESYYKDYRKDDWSFLVSKYDNNKIEQIEHGDYKFKKYNESDKEKYFIVYSWGSSKNSFVSEFDLRGH